MKIEITSYDYLRLTAWGPIKFGMSAKEIFKILGPTEGDLTMSEESTSFMHKLVDSIGMSMREKLEETYGERILSYDILDESLEETTMFLTLINERLDEIELLNYFSTIMLNDVNISDNDILARTKKLYQLSPKILMEVDNILFPELGIKYPQDPDDPSLNFLSVSGVQKKIEEGFYETETIENVIEIIESFYVEDEDED